MSLDLAALGRYAARDLNHPFPLCLEPHTVALADGSLWTVCADGVMAVVVPQLAGTPLWTGAGAAWLEATFGAQPYSHAAHRADLAVWAGSPEWPAVSRLQCALCHRIGVLPCPYDAARDPNFERLCLRCAHADDCCEWEYTCPNCGEGSGEKRYGWLADDLLVNRAFLARVLEVFTGSVVRLCLLPPVADLIGANVYSPIALTDGTARALLMPCLPEEEDAAAPRFSGLTVMP